MKNKHKKKPPKTKINQIKLNFIKKYSKIACIIISNNIISLPKITKKIYEKTIIWSFYTKLRIRL